MSGEESRCSTIAVIPDWLGTVHFDKEAKTNSGRGLLIHQVDPDIDRERDALRAVLLRSNCVRKIDEAVVTDPMAGKNARQSILYGRQSHCRLPGLQTGVVSRLRG
jgi:hypothetical protein